MVFWPAPQFSGLEGDLFLQEQLSPLSSVYFSARAFHTGPGIAYWLLVVGGIASFALARFRLPWWRLLIWSGFFALSLFRSQAIPFFAIIAGPILALNLADSVARAAASWRVWLRLANTVLIVAGLCLAAGAWAGWFQPGAHGPRSWTVEPDPVLMPAAGTIAQWGRQGKLANHRGFHLTPDAANYFAWFCPEEKSFVDSRWHVSHETATEYALVRAALLGREKPGAPDWRTLLRKHDINHVVIYSGDLAQTELAVRRLVADPKEWVLLHVKGGTAIFGWRDPQAVKVGEADPFADLRLDLDRLAFDPDAANPAPPHGPFSGEPGRSPAPYRWWDAFWKPQSTRSADLREAQLAVLCFDSQVPGRIQTHSESWNRLYFANMVLGGASLDPSGYEGVLGLASAPQRREAFFLSKDMGDLALPYLAIRAARRALAKNPDDYQAYFALARAYEQLSLTREQSWRLHFPSLARLRSVQTITALHNVLRLRPDMIEASDQLARIYWSMNYKDFALKHLKESLQHTRRRGPKAGESPEAFAKRLEARTARVQQVANEVEKLNKEFDIASQNMRVLDRARLAGKKGLAARALEDLLSSDVAAFGNEGMDHELKLLLITGDIEKVRRWMDPEKEKILDAYHWNKAQMHAAAGDYELADEELTAMMKITGPDNQLLDLHTAAGLMMGSAVLAETGGGLFHKLPLRIFFAVGKVPFRKVALFPDRDSTPIALMTIARELDRAAQTNVLRGLLALEAGQIAGARRDFQEALTFWNSHASAPSALRSPIGQHIARQCLGILERVSNSDRRPNP
jgi:tetratricopeptide (TPR) repeat protein